MTGVPPACLWGGELPGRELAALLDLLPEARLVGGAVRDTLAGLPIHDIDLASPLPPQIVMTRLREAGVKVVPTGLAHGTVSAILASGAVEITTLRRDIETDGRHAVVAFTNDWRADAARRDFTINAMSLTRDGTLFDYFDGAADLRAGRVRFAGDPPARIAEDYLRVLRYFRFFARYGNTPPDAATLKALRDAAPHLRSLSAERIWSELIRILSAPDPVAAIALADQLGVLRVVIQEGSDAWALTRLVAAGAPNDPLLRLAALLTGDPLRFAIRLKLSLAQRDRLLAIRAAPLLSPGADDATLRRALAETDPTHLIDKSWLGFGPADGAELRARLREMARPVFPLEGRDLLALGVSAGPQVGEILRTVRTWWLDGGCIADAAGCLVEAKTLI